MNSIFNNSNDEIDKIMRNQAAKTERTVNSGFDVSKIKDDYVKLRNGGVVHLRPAWLANQIAHLLNDMRSDGAYSFIKPFIMKPVIWTYEIDSACTDGIRIYMSPLFAHNMFLATINAVKEYKNTATYDELQDEEKYIQTENMIRTKLVRFAIVHEVYHILYNHVRRGILKYGSNAPASDHTLGNYAMDLEINRDIESCFPELRGSTETIGGVWWENEKFYSSKGEKFMREIWEDIWDDWKNSGKSFRQDDIFNEGANPTQKSNAQAGAYADGWRKAIDAIKNKQIDPKTFNI